jgi:hypothetical protein
MLKKRTFYLFILIFAVCLAAAGFFIKGEQLKAVSGVCIGVGAGLFGLSIDKLVLARLERKYPEIARQNEIEMKDERNVMIRDKAKARAADITHWLIIGIAFVLILIDAPLWATLTAVLVFSLYHIFSLAFMSAYRKKM